ncbi:MAG: hypothetical protein EOM59_20345 [Clostridia bacterium]|nr:hypothetical protein [Clostridia bacterium]
MKERLVNTGTRPKRIVEALRMSGASGGGIRIDSKNIVFGRGSAIGSSGEFILPRKVVVDIMNNALARKNASKE